MLTESIQLAAQAQYESDTSTLTVGSSGRIALALAAAEAAEAAIAAGATQAEIDEALAEIVVANAASTTLAQIVAFADANTAVTEALAAIDTDVVEAADDAATVAEVDTQIAANFVAYNALTDHKNAGLTDITDPGDLANASFTAPAAKVVADSHAANVAALQSKITISVAELAVEQAKIDAIAGLEDAYDAALIAATTFEAAVVADAATSKNATAATGAYNILNGTAVLNADGTVSDTAMVAVAQTAAGTPTIEAVLTFTFGALVTGQSVTVGDTTITATGGMTEAQVATAFRAAYVLDGFTGAIGANATDTVVYTAAAAGAYTLVANFRDLLSIGGTEVTNQGLAALKVAHVADLAAIAALATATTELTAAVKAVVDTEQGGNITVATGVLVTTTGKAVFDWDAVSPTTSAPKVDAYAKAQLDLEAANDAMTALVDAKADIDAILAIANTLEPLLEAASDAAGDLVGEITLADTNVITGTSGQDVYFIDALAAGDSATLSTNAVQAGKDYIFIGSDFTVNTDLDAGDNAVLEMFITEGTTEADTLLTFETKVFGSESTGDFFTILLTGVATTDVVVENGLVSFV